MTASEYLVAKVLVSTLVVLATFLACVWYVRRAGGLQSVEGRLKIRGRLLLGHASELLLVEAAGRLYLLGHSSKGFDLIDSLGEDGLSELDAPVEDAAKGLDSDMLHQLFRLDNLRRRERAD